MAPSPRTPASENSALINGSDRDPPLISPARNLCIVLVATVISGLLSYVVDQIAEAADDGLYDYDPVKDSIISMTSFSLFSTGLSSLFRHQLHKWQNKNREVIRGQEEAREAKELNYEANYELQEYYDSSFWSEVFINFGTATLGGAIGVLYDIYSEDPNPQSRSMTAAGFAAGSSGFSNATIRYLIYRCTGDQTIRLTPLRGSLSTGSGRSSGSTAARRGRPDGSSSSSTSFFKNSRDEENQEEPANAAAARQLFHSSSSDSE